MTTTRLFRSNTTQAVRLPKPVAFPETVRDVEIRVVGRSRVITPVGSAWAEWFDHGLVVPDFPGGRDQGVAQEREAW
ncbi:putative plasmid protein [Xylanimonas cellulosilytica DSM 15894]|uniref:Plasmid protein n=1 Tax=Xylanimonas cellulosilytica (strain DSM 15894 / JCM 12276 / CECT 5975 / KCTC 9989 / LMG 20990 / NBRC 107835 / XIL07) TaxID=446471 RepID=D1BU28_XYLCX|nr:type II toxin-antitoxin system VapB family antitoxin [Xylanimonas cellulosilytica]ACZ29192.1 putative plasmid protein [Xylanimonas cellulosilytica DSM 15894]